MQVIIQDFTLKSPFLWSLPAAKSLKLCPTLCDPIDSSPPRLPHPWDSPGKNTGVGCHFLLQCMKVKTEREVAQLCPTLSDPMDCSLPGTSIHGSFQVRVLEWVVIAFSGSLPRSLEKKKKANYSLHSASIVISEVFGTYSFLFHSGEYAHYILWTESPIKSGTICFFLLYPPHSPSSPLLSLPRGPHLSSKFRAWYTGRA